MTLRYLYILLIGLTVVSCKKPETSEPVSQSDTLVPYNYLKPRYLNRVLNEPADNKATVQGVELGRMLFYDKQLSLDGTISCASCHKQEFAFTDGMALGIGINNSILTRSSMSLSNKTWEQKQMWDGRFNSLEELIQGPILSVHEVAGNFPLIISRLQKDLRYQGKWKSAFLANDSVTQPRIEKALSQFVRSLQSVNSRYDKYLRSEITLTPDEEAGRILFFTHPDPANSVRGGNCGDCHSQGNLLGDLSEYRGFRNNGISTTQEQLNQDIGLKQVTGNNKDLGKFKVTSLRNIALTAPYMHDGRLATLEQVLDHYNNPMIATHPGVDSTIVHSTNERFGESLLLTNEEKRKIILFLHTLTDSTFIKNKAYSNPF